jgi:hypothetical protein
MPGRALLDTNIVNFTLDWGEAIFDGGHIPENLPPQDLDDILALRDIFLTGKRAMWQLAISPLTYREIQATVDHRRRQALIRWFNELWVYWRDIFKDCDLSDDHAELTARRLCPSGFLTWLPGEVDRILVSHAIAYGCDVFCTRDRNTILRHRARAKGIPVHFHSPAEWWSVLSPYGALFA